MSADYNVVVPENFTNAVLWIDDNEGILHAHVFLNHLFILIYPDLETLAYIHLEESHYSVVERGSFEVCVVAVNHSPINLTLTIWLRIAGITCMNYVVQHLWVVQHLCVHIYCIIMYYYVYRL